MGGSLCNRAQADHNETSEEKELMHPPSIVEMKHGHICKHSKLFFEQQDSDRAGGEEQPRKGVFYHPKIECKVHQRDCLDMHPARMNTHMYTVYGGAARDKGRCVYLIDEHKK